MTKFWIGLAAVSAICVVSASAEPVAVLNALQLSTEDVDLGLEEAAPAAAANDAPALDLGALLGDEAETAPEPAVEPAATPALDLGDLLGEEVAAAPEAPAATADAAPALDLGALLGDEAETAPEPAVEPAATPALDLGDLLGGAVEAAPVVEAEAVPELALEEPVVAAPEAVAPVVDVTAGDLAVEDSVVEVADGAETEAVVEVPAVADDPMAAIVSEMEALERVRREAQDQHGMASLTQAVDAMNVGKYEQAISLYDEALKYIGDRPSNSILRNQADLGIQEAYYRQALLLERRENLAEAHKNALRARQLGHPKGEELATRLKNLIDFPAPPPPPKLEKRWNEPSYRERQAANKSLMNRAREFYATGEYDRCREQLELIMRDSPFNTEAIAMLQKLGNRRYDVADSEFEATRREMIREVKHIWTPQNYAKDFTDIGLGATTREATATNEFTTVSMRIKEKMQRIVIPEVNFRDANLTDVIAFLSDASREYDDPDTPVEQRGINFSLMLSTGGSFTADQPDALGAADPFNIQPIAAPSGGGGSSTPISFQASYVALLDVLDVIMGYAHLKYRIRGNIVQILPADAPDTELMHRMYNVLPTLMERIANFRSDRLAAGGTSADPWGGGGGGGETITSQSDWKKFFEELGVSWPTGSTVQHMPSIGKLVVKNTVDNLATLEMVLGVLNVTPKQVEIEARFVEVMQSDLESMGFEWILNNNWEMLEHKADAHLPLQARRRVIMEKSNFNSGFGYLNTRGLIGEGGQTIADDVLKVSSVLTNPELSMVLHMLSQRENTDLLSAPKVVTQNGSEATIKVVTEYIYPTEFTVVQPEVNNGGAGVGAGQINTLPAVEPGGFEMREVGVILTVVPDVTQDGQMINLTMAPEVVSEPMWKDYGPIYPDGTQLPMEQPWFPRRSIATSIQIYNGATVVMGGMITEVRNSREDKTPFLGDIPLIGRLFRYRYEASEKRNLLIFVTAKLVDPAGRVVKDRQDLPLLPLAAAAGAGIP